MAKNIRGKNMMYVQSVEHLPFNSLKDLINHIKKELKPIKVAGIIHNKDFKDDGKPEKDHVHVMLQFENARSLKNIAKLLHDKPERIEKWNERADTGFSYLIHETTNSLTKHQYSPDDVIANFDYSSFLEEVRKKVKEQSKNKTIREKQRINDLLEALLCGEISKEKLESKLSASQLANYNRKIEIIYQRSLENNAKQWKETMIKEGKKIETIWIYGYSGAGKTRYAKKYAEDSEEKYFLSGSSKDPFQEYVNEHIVILDELRPSTFYYSDLLKMLDPYNFEGSSPARYKDKNLVVHTFIVTTPYSPKEFFESIVQNNPKQLDVKIDTFYQLARRLHKVIYLTEQKKEIKIYDDTKDDFI